MIRKGQIFTLRNALDRFTVEEITPEYVKISCLNGGAYEVYRTGKIVACSYMGIRGKRKELSQHLSRNGYYRVKLRFCHRQVNVSVHRLVAMCFIPNPYNLPCINHKSEIKTENFVENLEWCDVKYNVTYSLNLNDPTRIGRLIKMDAEKRAKVLKTNQSKATTVKLTKEKVRSMLPTDLIAIPCDSAGELDAVYQTAFNARKEMGEKGNDIALSRSNVTMTVVVRKGGAQ